MVSNINTLTIIDCHLAGGSRQAQIMGTKHPLEAGNVCEHLSKKPKSGSNAHTLSDHRACDRSAINEGALDASPGNNTQGVDPDIGTEEHRVVTSNARGNLATRVAPVAQLCREVLNHPELAGEFTAQFGYDATKAVLDLGKVLNPEQSLVTASFDTASSKAKVRLAVISSQAPHPKHSTVSLPEAPSIQDPSLAEVPFTSRFAIGSLQLGAAANATYERLEFLGDAYIELFASRLIYPRYPDLPPGRLSQIRESLVKNQTLAEFSIAYKFHDRIELPPSHTQGREKLVTKLLGDVFEAYVAAIVLSHPYDGFGVAESWLAALWTPMLPGNEKVALPQNAQAKQDLSARIMSKGTRIEYRDHGQSMVKNEGKIWFTVGVYFNGHHWKNQLLGSGRGLSKSEAGARAAMEALSSPLTVTITAAKKSYDAKLKQERERQVA